jgi:hypothetical protein
MAMIAWTRLTSSCLFLLTVCCLGCDAAKPATTSHRESLSRGPTTVQTPNQSLPARETKENSVNEPQSGETPPTATKNESLAKPSEPPTAGKRTALNKQRTLFLETLPGDQRRVVIRAAVCLREGPLELLLCRQQTKEHEAILHADVNAKDIHAALEVCRAKPGSPVKYTDDLKIIPPHGTTIRVELQYERLPGQWEIVNARKWIRQARSDKELDRDWVFAGSALWTDPDDPEKTVYYLANNGNVISVANFNDALLDLPIASSQANAELIFECWTDRIPPVGTTVYVILTPILDEPKP